MDRTRTAHDELVNSGMGAMLQLLAEAEQHGARQVGWKAGLGTAAARAALGTAAPLVGFLLDTSRTTPGASVTLTGWAAPRAEAEIALRIARDVPAGTPPDRVVEHVDAFAPAIELVDLDPPPTEVARVLSGNIYHRAWCTGAFRPLTAALDLRTSGASIRSMDVDLEPVSDVEAATGPAREVLAEVGRIAVRSGRGLRRGDIVILGSMVPPQTIGAGGTFTVALDDAEPVSVRFV